MRPQERVYIITAPPCIRALLSYLCAPWSIVNSFHSPFCCKMWTTFFPSRSVLLVFFFLSDFLFVLKLPPSPLQSPLVFRSPPARSTKGKGQVRAAVVPRSPRFVPVEHLLLPRRLSVSFAARLNSHTRLLSLSSIAFTYQIPRNSPPASSSVPPSSVIRSVPSPPFFFLTFLRDQASAPHIAPHARPARSPLVTASFLRNFRFSQGVAALATSWIRMDTNLPLLPPSLCLACSFVRSPATSPSLFGSTPTPSPVLHLYALLR